MIEVRLLSTADEIMSSFDVMVQLRPHLSQEGYLERIRQQQAQGYRLAAAIADNRVKAVAGFRVVENLAWGKFLYLDDLITDEGSRRHGYAQALWQWLVEWGKQEHCEQFHLDSGVVRHAAHRFYLKNGMDITCHHFGLPLSR